MKVKKVDAVAICQDYGFATADGWDDPKVVKKFTAVIKLYRSGEYDWADKDLLPIIEGLAEAEDFELVDELDEEEKTEESVEAPEDDEDEDWDDVDEEDVDEEKGTLPVDDVQDEGDPKDCPLQGGERVLVHDSDETWKGMVNEAITACRVHVRDRKGEEYEVVVEKCEVVKKKVKEVKDEDEDDKQIRELREKLAEMKKSKPKGGAKKGKGKKLNRVQMALKVLKERESPGTVAEIAEEVEVDYVDQGRTANLRSSETSVKRLVTFGVLFEVVEQRKDKFRWARSE